MGHQWEAEHAVSEEVAREIINGQFPELYPASMEVIGEGWDNVVFLVNQHFVFRFPRRNIAVELLTTENQVLPQLANRLPLPIPTPCFIGKSTAGYPFPFSGYRKLEGTVPYLRSLTANSRALSASVWGNFLRVLHCVPAPDAISWGVPASDVIGRMDLAKRLPIFLKNIARCTEAGLIDYGRLLEEVAEDTGGLESSVSHGSKCLVHGDLNFRNFLLGEEDVVCAVLDWGDVHIGSPAVDLSILYSFLPKQSRCDFLEAYGHVSPETLKLARFRSLYTNLVILDYAHDVGDVLQFAEAEKAIAIALDELC